MEKLIQRKDAQLLPEADEGRHRDTADNRAHPASKRVNSIRRAPFSPVSLIIARAGPGATGSSQNGSPSMKKCVLPNRLSIRTSKSWYYFQSFSTPLHHSFSPPASTNAFMSPTST